MHTYEANQNTNGCYSLVRDGNVCRCPKSTVELPQINNVTNQMTVMPTQMTCCTLCPFAELREVPGTQEPKKIEYITSCEGRDKTFEIEKINKPAGEKKMASVLTLNVD